MKTKILNQIKSCFLKTFTLFSSIVDNLIVQQFANFHRYTICRICFHFFQGCIKTFNLIAIQTWQVIHKVIWFSINVIVENELRKQYFSIIFEKCCIISYDNKVVGFDSTLTVSLHVVYIHLLLFCVHGLHTCDKLFVRLASKYWR